LSIETSIGGALLSGWNAVTRFFSDKPIDSPICPCPDKIKQALDDTHWFQRDDAAREIVESLSDAELKGLPVDLKRRLLLEMRSGYTTDAEQAAIKRVIRNLTDADIAQLSVDEKCAALRDLRKGGMSDVDKVAQRTIYRDTPLTPEFMKDEAEKRQKLIDEIQSDPETANARENWDTLSVYDKRNYLQSVADKQAEIFGFKTVPISASMDQPAANGLITNGYFDPSKNEIVLNKDASASLSTSFKASVDLIVHENAHNYQDQLAQKSAAGKIPESDPTYEQSKLFAVNGEPDGYVTAIVESDLADYRAQPMERNSWEIGPAVGDAVALPVVP
jgi:hypothetical protein